jgi:hypothetical protein
MWESRAAAEEISVPRWNYTFVIFGKIGDVYERILSYTYRTGSSKSGSVKMGVAGEFE